jgi:PAS domain S-box-containing protein
MLYCLHEKKWSPQQNINHRGHRMDNSGLEKEFFPASAQALPVAARLPLVGSATAVAFLDRRFCIQRVEGPLLATLALSDADLVGRTVAEAFPHLAAMGGRSFRAVLRGQTVNTACEYGGRMVSCQLLPMPGNQGRVESVIAFCQDVGAQYALEAQLQETEELKQLALAAAGLGLWSMDLQTGLTHWDQRTREIFDVAPEVPASLDKGLSIIHPDDRERAAQLFDEALRPEGSGRYQMEKRIVVGDGSVRWINSSGRVYFEGPGNHQRAVRISGVVMDITARKQSEAAWRQSETLLGMVLKHAPIVLWEQDRELRYRWIYNSQLGYRDDEVLGKRDVDLMERREDAERTESLKREVVETGVGRVEEVAVTRQGRVHHYELTIRPLPSPDGKVQAIACVAYDISERRQAEIEREQLVAALAEVNETLETQVQERTRMLRVSEKRYRALVEASAQIVWFADAQGMTVEVSPSWSAFTRQSHEEWLGWGWLDAVHPDEQVRTASAWAGCIENQVPFEAEYRVRHVSGEWRWTEVRAVPLRDAAGALQGWVGMNSDVTERKQAEREIRHLASQVTMAEQEERQRIAQFLHDDIQQMLVSLNIRLSILRDDLDPAVQAEVKELETFVKAITSAVRSLSTELMAPIMKSEELADAFTWLAGLMRERYQLRVHVRAERPCRVPDRNLRALILKSARELLFNVVKHAGVKEAQVEVRDGDPSVTIRISDDGQGFDVRTALKKSGIGASLGLFSVGERIRLFGGTLEIRSEPGTGTHVTMTVPKIPG